MNKQIEEMARAIGNSRNACFFDDCLKCRAYGECMYQEIAQDLYDNGYRKQTEGEWNAEKSITIRVYETDSITCSACGEHSHGNISSGGYPNYCPKCGAKMRGGKE